MKVQAREGNGEGERDSTDCWNGMEKRAREGGRESGDIELSDLM